MDDSKCPKGRECPNCGNDDIDTLLIYSDYDGALCEKCGGRYLFPRGGEMTSPLLRSLETALAYALPVRNLSDPVVVFITDAIRAEREYLRELSRIDAENPNSNAEVRG